MGLGGGLCGKGGQTVVERVPILVFVFCLGHGGRDGGGAGHGWSFVVSFENMDACFVHIRGSICFLAVFLTWTLAPRVLLAAAEFSRHPHGIAGANEGLDFTQPLRPFLPRLHGPMIYIGRCPLLMEHTSGNLNWMIEGSRIRTLLGF